MTCAIDPIGLHTRRSGLHNRYRTYATERCAFVHSNSERYDVTVMLWEAARPGSPLAISACGKHVGPASAVRKPRSAGQNWLATHFWVARIAVSTTKIAKISWIVKWCWTDFSLHSGSIIIIVVRICSVALYSFCSGIKNNVEMCTMFFLA